MKNIYKIISCLTLLTVLSCNQSEDIITNPEDYSAYLNTSNNEALQQIQSDFNFWEEKLEKEKNQFPYLAKKAASLSQLFTATGKIEYLIQAEEQLIKANEATNYTTAGYLKALASNYISQHKFKEALNLLTKAEKIGEKLEGTQKMLFDVHLELGNYELAKTYLSKFKNFSDFDYLIRLSKWSDHNGNLDAAIKYLEKAKTIAESSNLSGTKQWVYSNLADYYGHAGNIEASYNHFLMALEIDSNDAYAKKGIAWIVYSHEKNPDEALRILNTVTTTFFAPDYNLLKAEIAEFKGDVSLKEEHLKQYQKVMSNTLYGDMYNKYNVLLNVDESINLGKAIAIATTEIENRPTPQSYDLLAWTLFKDGNVDKALEIVETHIIDKTFEPETLYRVAEIYKAVGNMDKAKDIKKELLGSVYELGPIIAQQINQI